MILSLIFAFVAGALLFSTIVFSRKYKKAKASYDSLYQYVRERQKKTRRIKVEVASSYDPDMLSQQETNLIRWELIKQIGRKINKKSQVEFRDGVFTMEYDVIQIIKDESGKSI